MARKKIICLANSRKLQKHCVAGKDSDGNWIRLVNPGGSELALEDIINERGEQPKLLETWEIEVMIPLQKQVV